MRLSHSRVTPQDPGFWVPPQGLGPTFPVCLSKYHICNDNKSCGKILVSILHNLKFHLQKLLPEVFYKKKLFLSISQYSQETTCVGVFFNKVKLKVSRYSLENTFLGFSSTTGVFLWILQNFEKQLF